LSRFRAGLHVPFDLTLPRFSWLANRLSPRAEQARMVVAAAPRMDRVHCTAAGGAFALSSIAWPLIGVLVLVASWTVGISYYFHHQSTGRQFLVDQQTRGARARALVESTIAADYAAVERSAHALAERS
jgi:hypothetical protein